MSRYITLGADENGQVYGLELKEDGNWRHNSQGYSTSCAVIRPISEEDYEYMTNDPESAKELWQACVADDRTELGLEEWFKEYVSYDDPFDASFVHELLDDRDNPTIMGWNYDRPSYGSQEFRSFRDYLESVLVDLDVVSGVSCCDDVYEWESSGWFPPKRPFVAEFASEELLKEYYAHLRETYEEFKG